MGAGRLLGVGLDLGPEFGQADHRSPGHFEGQRKFFERYRERFHYAFCSLQLEDSEALISAPSKARLHEKVRRFRANFPREDWPLALHHTFLNLGSADAAYPRDEIVDFTNRLIQKFGVRWVNEDLGLWFLSGKRVPYPFAPVLSKESVQVCVDNIQRVEARLEAPLLVEFPGYSEGSSFPLGDMGQIDFFCEVVKASGCLWTLDTGHVLAAMLADGLVLDEVSIGKVLDRLPLSRCREVHLSGCALVRGEFLDLHHGILMSEQLVLLRKLKERETLLWGICYEDPKYDLRGELIPQAAGMFGELLEEVEKWKV